MRRPQLHVHPWPCTCGPAAVLVYTASGQMGGTGRTRACPWSWGRCSPHCGAEGRTAHTRYMSTHILAYTHTYVHTHTCTCTHAYCTYVHTRPRMYTHTHSHTHTQTQTHTHHTNTNTHTHTHTHTHTCTRCAHFENGVCMLQEPANQGVSSFVVRHHLPLLHSQRVVLLLHPCTHKRMTQALSHVSPDSYNNNTEQELQ